MQENTEYSDDSWSTGSEDADSDDDHDLTVEEQNVCTAQFVAMSKRMYLF
jgi:hypothetical protein